MDKEQIRERSQNSIIDDIPDGGYGWFVVLGAWFLNFSTWGANAGYSTYLAHYLQHSQFKGANKLDYAAIGGIAFGSGMMIGPLIWLLVQRTSVRITVGIGATLQFTGTLLAAFTTQLWQIYLTQGLLIGLGLGLNFIPTVVVLAPWFRKKRSLAQSIASAGSGVGGVVFNLSVQAIIKNISLKWALIIQAIMCAAYNALGILLIRPRDKRVSKNMRVWDSEMIQSPVYCMFAFYLCTALLGYLVLLYNLADFTISLGYSAHQGSVVACMISLGNVCGRPLVGQIADHVGPVTTNIFCYLIVAILSFAMWIPARNIATAMAFALTQGALMGTLWVVIGSIGARLVGLNKLNVALSMTWVFMGAFSIVSPIISLTLRSNDLSNGDPDPTHYRNPAIYCGSCFIVSALTLWCIRGYLIARDRLAAAIGSHEDSDECHLRVVPSQALRAMFELSRERNV